MTAKQKAAFLAQIEKQPTMGNKRAWRAVGIKLTEAQIAAEFAEDEDFKADYDAARGRDHEEIRQAIRLRAIDGVEEPVYTPSGKLAGTRLVFSDRLLALMAKANLPEYGDRRTVELTGAAGGPVEVSHVDAFDREIARLMDELAPAGETPPRDGAAPAPLGGAGPEGTAAA